MFQELSTSVQGVQGGVQGAFKVRASTGASVQGVIGDFNFLVI